nr:M56 family metallopeptidase [uncultured Arsenicibacter sp.]
MNPLAYLLQISVLLITFSLGYYVLLRNLTFFQTNRLLLWAGLGAALLLPLADLPDVRPAPVRNVIRKTTAALRPQLLPASQPEAPVVITYPDRKSYRVRLHNDTPQAFPWGTAVLSLYAIVTIVLLVRLAFQLRSLRRLIDRSAHEAYEDFTLVISPQTTSPFSFFKWVVINPAHHSPFEQEHILRHERVHVRQWHSVDTLVAEVLCILFWFNPAIWLFKKLVHQTLEYLADRTVLAEGVDARAYQFHLVKATLGVDPAQTITNHFSKSDLKKRITMINKPHSRWYQTFNYLLLMGTTLMVMSAFVKPKAEAIARTLPLITPAVPETKAIAAHPSRPETPKRPDMKKGTTQTAAFKYIYQSKGQIHWLVTPKNSFEDLTMARAELAKLGLKLEIRDLKFDQLYTYISQLQARIVTAEGVSGTVDNEQGLNHKPIHCWIMSIGTGDQNGAFTVQALTDLAKPNTDTDVPDKLYELARKDEAEAAAFLQKNKFSYLIEDGKRMFENTGLTILTKPVEYLSNKNIPNRTGLLVNTDSTLTLQPEFSQTLVFLNNALIKPQDIQTLKAGQLHTILVHESAGKAVALLLYIKEN